MLKVQVFNAVADSGLRRLPPEHYVLERAPNKPLEDADAILLRSHPLQEAEIKPSTLAVVRVGAGVNNIPVDFCTARGIPVFNTPGANANAVKELVVASLLLASRNIAEGISYVGGIKKDCDEAELTKLVEGEKKRFKGVELIDKTLGVIGLGAIGSQVAEIGVALGMRVKGYDPELSIETALRLPREVQRITDLPSLAASSDYVTLHVPLIAGTRHLVARPLLEHFKQGACLLNFSRAEVVSVPDVVAALDAGRISRFVTDFPHPGFRGRDDSILLPHLGACTREAEENCAVVAAELLRDFLERGNIRSSVNFPSIRLDGRGKSRVAVSNRNVPRMINQITKILADAEINVVDMLNKSRDDIAYNLIDTESVPSPQVIERLRGVSGVLRVRVVE